MPDVFDHPWLGGLFRDPETAEIWSPGAQLDAMIAFEAAWSRAGHLAGLWSREAGEVAAVAIESAQIAPSDLAAGTAVDGVPVPALVDRLRSAAGTRAVHSGATSQDLIDTATVLSLIASLDLFDARLATLGAALDDLRNRFGDRPMMGRTRMQAARPITVGDRVRTWSDPLRAHRARLAELRPRVALVQIGGAVGDRAALGAGADAVVAAVARDLGLAAAPAGWHATRDPLAEAASLMSLICGSLGKFGQDVCLMAQQGVDEIALSEGGGSSAMPHKRNPVAAELLVALARFNATQLAGMHQALVHEQERSGAAWMLEWMVLPQMAQATGRALCAATDLLASVSGMGRAQTP